ncbi:MAG: leucine-rich repeat protein [Eubacteriales bacterium]
MNALAMGNSITDIGGRAFEDCTGIKSIIVPSSVKSIGKNAFAGCTGLTLVTFINTSGWFYSADSTVTLGTAISVGDAKTNADNLRATYSDYYWFRK